VWHSLIAGLCTQGSLPVRFPFDSSQNPLGQGILSIQVTAGETKPKGRGRTYLRVSVCNGWRQGLAGPSAKATLAASSICHPHCVPTMRPGQCLGGMPRQGCYEKIPRASWEAQPRVRC
jgi:hypothetical protein